MAGPLQRQHLLVGQSQPPAGPRRQRRHPRRVAAEVAGLHVRVLAHRADGPLQIRPGQAARPTRLGGQGRLPQRRLLERVEHRGRALDDDLRQIGGVPLAGPTADHLHGGVAAGQSVHHLDVGGHVGQQDRAIDGLVLEVRRLPLAVPALEHLLQPALDAGPQAQPARQPLAHLAVDGRGAHDPGQPGKGPRHLGRPAQGG